VMNPIFDAQSNIIGILNMVLTAKKYGVRTFIFSSSAAVYGTPNSVVVPEEHPTHPEAPYGISKLAGELYLQVYKDKNLKIVTFRFGNVYGDRQSVGSTEGAFIPRIIANIKEGIDSELRGYGKPIRDFVYVEDIAQAVYLALDGPAGTYNLATASGHSVEEVWSSVSVAMQERGFKVQEPKRVPLMPGEIEKIILSTDRARTLLGWQARMPLQQGIENTVEYYAPRK
jgi:nucleoside-diphosphate-sugar epimerase